MVTGDVLFVCQWRGCRTDIRTLKGLVLCQGRPYCRDRCHQADHVNHATRASA